MKAKKIPKIFLNFEKRHFQNGVISQLKVSDNEFVTSDKQILKECETFYRNIYSSRNDKDDSEISNLSFFLNN